MEVYPKVTPHPAKYSAAVTDQIGAFILDDLPKPLFILDPFAGVGGVHEFDSEALGIHTFGIELEPEWADQHPRTTVGDAMELIKICEREDWPITTIVTSPCYGNRMADHHNAKDSSTRITYKHKLGRDLSEGSSAVMQWGDAYRSFHWKVWARCTRLIKRQLFFSPGFFILNCKDHVRGDVVQRVTNWHVQCLVAMGWKLVKIEKVDTPGMGFGANRELRAPEYVALLRYDERP